MFHFVEKVLDSVNYTSNKRILNEKPTKDTKDTDDNYVIPISAPGFAAYFVSLCALIAIYYATEFLGDIKTPARFYDRQFHFGKEH